uniref:C-type lectin domain-containing protein n=1 Tax=Cyprinus carpio carpio TaxID=630221 RepID=A0A9J8C348_CYPCA
RSAMDMETIITTLLFLSLFGLNSGYRTHIFVNEKKNWKDALDYCIERNTSLASMNSSTIMDLAVNMAKNAQTVNVWTGLRFLNHWFWVNGGDLEYKAWSEEGEVQCPAMNQRNYIYYITIYCIKFTKV